METKQKILTINDFDRLKQLSSNDDTKELAETIIENCDIQQSFLVIVALIGSNTSLMNSKKVFHSNRFIYYIQKVLKYDISLLNLDNIMLILQKNGEFLNRPYTRVEYNFVIDQYVCKNCEKSELFEFKPVIKKKK